MTALFNLIERLRFLFLFFVLLLFCFIKALDAQFLWEGFADLFLFILIVCSLVVIGEETKRFLLGLIIIAVIELALLTVSFFTDQLMWAVIKAFFTMIYFVLMAAACLHYTLRDKRIDVTTLFGSLSAYLFVGLAYAYLYIFIYTLDPHAFSGLDVSYQNNAIYFSFTTLTTLGFGDIVPKSPITQTLSWFESFTGQAYLAIIMAQLVGRYVADRLGS